MQFGKIKKVKITDIWQNEPRYFTPWLAENIGKLGEALGMELESKEIEVPVGGFSLDLLAKDLGSGRSVVIENQFGQTNHDHLGKLLTYAAGFNASTVVWIAESVRDEYRQALEWLNQRTDEDTQFFGVEIEVIRIDDSQPAFIFKPVVSPSEWQKSKKGQMGKSISVKGEAYRKYFQTLIDELRNRYHFTNARKAQPQCWYSFASGISGITLAAVFAQGGRARTELYIDVGSAEKNKALFDWLEEQKEEIHSKNGETFEWERMENRRGSRIAIYREGTIEATEEELEEIKDWHIGKLIKIKKVLVPMVKNYKENPL